MKATACARSPVDHPFFARVWPVVATHEAKAVQALRRENLAGLSGRVLEVGAGIGTNFAFYPETVEQVIAVEPEPRLRARAARRSRERTRSRHRDRRDDGAVQRRGAV